MSCSDVIPVSITLPYSRGCGCIWSWNLRKNYSYYPLSQSINTHLLWWTVVGMDGWGEGSYLLWVKPCWELVLKTEILFLSTSSQMPVFLMVTQRKCAVVVSIFEFLWSLSFSENPTFFLLVLKENQVDLPVHLRRGIAISLVFTRNNPYVLSPLSLRDSTLSLLDGAPAADLSVSFAHKAAAHMKVSINPQPHTGYCQLWCILQKTSKRYYQASRFQQCN